MNRLSRREFLKRTGTAAFAAPIALNSTSALVKAPSTPSSTIESVGRAFDLTSVYTQPHLDSQIVAQLAPDSVNTIAEISGDQGWYRVAHGWVPRDALQPILQYQYPAIHPATAGFWAEVVAPVSAVRRWCAAGAPIVARLGFGAVMYIVDRIDDDSEQAWYGLAAEPESPLVGWSPALHFARWTPLQSQNIDELSIEIKSHESQLGVSANGKVIARLPLYAVPLASAVTTIQAMQPGAGSRSHIMGTPWLMQLGTGISMYGAFWHNRFGTVNPDADDPSIALGTFTARWLYETLLSSGSVPVRIIA